MKNPLNALFLLSVLLVGSSASGHPHVWVSLTSDFVIDEQANLVAIRQRWIFDALYSALTLHDIRSELGEDSAALRAHSNRMVEHMATTDYFSHIKMAGQPITLPKPEKWHLSTATLDDEELMILEMHFPLTPRAITDGPLQWQVYDPSYYVAMEHYEPNHVRIFNNSSAECQPEIVAGTPTDAQILLASALDRTQQSPDGLGKYFAQTVTIECF